MSYKMHALKNVCNKYFFCLISFAVITVETNAQSCTKAFHVVVLGSSTAFGDGASPGKSWVALYTDYLKNINSNYVVDNVAVPGTTTYIMQADNYVPPQGRPLPMKG